MAFIIPWVFRAGTKAKSAEVNENFLAVKQFVDLLEEDVAANQVMVQTLDDTKANINGNPVERFQVANAVVGSDAVNLNSLKKNTQNSRGYINGYELTATNKIITASIGSCYSYNPTTGEYEYLIETSSASQTDTLTLGANAKYYVFICGDSSNINYPQLSVTNNTTTPSLPDGLNCWRKIGSFTTDTNGNIKEIINEGQKSLVNYIKYPNYATGVDRNAGTTYTADKNGMITISLRMNNNATTTFTINGVTVCSFFGGAEHTSNEHFTCFVSAGDKYLLANTGINNKVIYKFFQEK